MSLFFKPASTARSDLEHTKRAAKKIYPGARIVQEPNQFQRLWSPMLQALDQFACLGQNPELNELAQNL